MSNSLTSLLWQEKCVNSECTLHQIAPYIGKLKSTIANTLIKKYSKEGNTVLDPFVGSGTIALESVLLNRNIICYDINPYAVLLTKAKINPPKQKEALDNTIKYLKDAKIKEQEVIIEDIPTWVQQFYHPKTLREIVSFRNILIKNDDYFILSCLLGILHHQRAGFLSYPSSYSIPYLRNKKYPQNTNPDLYEYRELKKRIINKILRVYKRTPIINESLTRICEYKDANNIELPKNSIDLVLTSPPYMDTLDYYRDNRLRLWFLGYDYYNKEMHPNPKNITDFTFLMEKVFNTFTYILKPHGYGILILGNIRKNNFINTSQIIQDIINNKNELEMENIINDNIRSHYGKINKNNLYEKEEKIIVFRKKI